jgi:squalene-associated FAD-dependent desaturase
MRPVVIIGGGFAGLAAGVALAERGIAATVLEARGRLGGRAYSFTDRGTGAEVDNGQHAMMGCYTHALRFFDTVGATPKLHRQRRLRVDMRHARLGSGCIAAQPLPGPLHMVGALLRYRLLSRRERAAAMLAGSRVMSWHRRNDPRLETGTVADLLRGLGQSANACANFWHPVAVATLNEEPQRAAAAPFAEVLARAFFDTPAAAQFVLPRVGLSRLYTDDARRFIEQHGGQVCLRTPVAAIEVGDRHGLRLRLRDGGVLTAAACISAVPPQALLPLLPPALHGTPGLRHLGAFETSPIVSVHLWFERAVLDVEFAGLLGTTTQWVFDRSRLLARSARQGHGVSAVISAARPQVEWDADCIVQRVVEDIRCCFPAARGVPLQRAVVVKERHATVSTTPHAERLRPPAETPLPALVLAGDWTRTGLPPVIEGAVASGQRAAAVVATRLGAQ